MKIRVKMEMVLESDNVDKLMENLGIDASILEGVDLAQRNDVIDKALNGVAEELRKEMLEDSKKIVTSSEVSVRRI